MLFWIPPAAAIALTIAYLYMSEPPPIWKAIVVVVVVVALFLQFGSGSIGGWLIGLLLSVGVSLYIGFYLKLRL